MDIPNLDTEIEESIYYSYGKEKVTRELIQKTVNIETELKRLHGIALDTYSYGQEVGYGIFDSYLFYGGYDNRQIADKIIDWSRRRYPEGYEVLQDSILKGFIDFSTLETKDYGKEAYLVFEEDRTANNGNGYYKILTPAGLNEVLSKQKEAILKDAIAREADYWGL